MRSWIAPLLLAAASLGNAVAAGPEAPMAWHDVGPLVDDTQYSRTPALAIGGRQQPVVAYVRTTAQSDGRQVANVFVERWNGTAWVQLGAALNLRRRMAAEIPQVVIDAQDRPIVAWYESQTEVGSRYQVYVKRWNGSVWEQLGAALNTDTRLSALSHSIAIGPDQQPVVAMAESAVGGLAVRVRRWDGAQWQLIGGPAEIGLGAATQVAVDGAGRIAVAFVGNYSTDDRKILVKRWDGSQWTALGDALNRDASRPAVSPSLVAAADGSLTIAWQEQAENAGKVYAAHWPADGTAWSPLGGALDGGSALRSTVMPQLALLKSGLPVVAWTEAQTMHTFVERWNGSAWVLLGDNPVAAASQRGYDLQVDGKGRPVLAHAESHAIFVGDLRVQRFGP